MARPHVRLLLLAVACALVLLPGDARGQELGLPSTERDPVSLAARLLGVPAPGPVVPPLLEPPEPGDTVQLWIGKAGEAAPVVVTARLAAAAPSIYLWAETGLAYDGAAMAQAAFTLSSIWDVVRWRGGYQAQRNLQGEFGQVLDPRDVLPIPDVDGDPHLNIVFAGGLEEDRLVVYNPNNSLLPALAPQGYSNGREMLVVNGTQFPGAALSDDRYLVAIIQGMVEFVGAASAPDQPPWLREAMGAFTTRRFTQSPLSPVEIAPFLAAPDTPLLRSSTLTTRAAAGGGQLLFLAYLIQRYGQGVVLDLFLRDEPGLGALDATLRARGVVDPATGADVTGADAFADFVMANALDTPFGDGRYQHLAAQLPEGQVAAAEAVDLTAGARLEGRQVSPFGTVYFAEAAGSGAVTVRFVGTDELALLPLPADTSPGDRFYWSGRGRNRDHTLTRALDLRDVDEATLTFDVWYSLADGWDYGYVEVSSDGGATWDLLPADNRTGTNRHGLAYGPGFTGISNPSGPRPFPVMGIVVAADAMTVAEVVAGGAAGEAGVRAGDQIVGYNGRAWDRAPNVLGMLGQFAPGDTVTLMIRRGSQTLDIPVLLRAHETRIVQPEPLWLRQEADLSPWAGQEILLRFEYVSLPARSGEGIAVDNIAVPEIGFLDDGSGDSAWTMQGWQRTDNRVPARYVVQAATLGRTAQSRVLRLLGPGDGDEGEWTLPLEAGEQLLVAVTSVNEDTFQPAWFDLEIAPFTPASAP